MGFASSHMEDLPSIKSDHSQVAQNKSHNKEHLLGLNSDHFRRQNTNAFILHVILALLDVIIYLLFLSFEESDWAEIIGKYKKMM